MLFKNSAIVLLKFHILYLGFCVCVCEPMSLIRVSYRTMNGGKVISRSMDNLPGSTPLKNILPSPLKELVTYK